VKSRPARNSSLISAKGPSSRQVPRTSLPASDKRVDPAYLHTRTDRGASGKLTTVPLSILTDEQLTGLPDKLTFVHWHLESMQAYGEEMHRGGFKCRGERLGRAGDGVRG
jgi:hypothetical protein